MIRRVWRQDPTSRGRSWSEKTHLSFLALVQSLRREIMKINNKVINMSQIKSAVWNKWLIIWDYHVKLNQVKQVNRKYSESVNMKYWLPSVLWQNLFPEPHSSDGQRSALKHTTLSANHSVSMTAAPNKHEESIKEICFKLIQILSC